MANCDTCGRDCSNHQWMGDDGHCDEWESRVEVDITTMDDGKVHCSQCANCVRYLLPPEEFGCDCDELGEIGAHETVGACAYFQSK